MLTCPVKSLDVFESCRPLDMTFVATCTCVLTLISVATAKIVWNPLATPQGDDRHNITFSRWAIYEPKYNPTAKVWDGNQIGTQYVPSLK